MKKSSVKALRLTAMCVVLGSGLAACGGGGGNGYSFPIADDDPRSPRRRHRRRRTPAWPISRSPSSATA